MHNSTNSIQLSNKIKLLATNLGFAQVGITQPYIDTTAAKRLKQWLEQSHHGTMAFLQKNIKQRTEPQQFIPWVKSIICCRLNYQQPISIQNNYIAYYALCCDYHQVMHSHLNMLVEQIRQLLNNSQQSYNFYICCDSAPVMEKTLAAQAGIGWIGKNTLLLNKDSGTMSFLGEIYTDLLLAPDKPLHESCGNCTKCLNACPTQALNTAYSLNASQCIAYLTIEHKGSIPLHLRKKIGTRIFGCTECQKCCPWNDKTMKNFTKDKKFYVPAAKQNIKEATLAEMFLWDKATYIKNTAGTPLQRLGFTRWLRNLAIALGNSPATEENIQVLQTRLNHPSLQVREHVTWALKELLANQCPL